MIRSLKYGKQLAIQPVFEKFCEYLEIPSLSHSEEKMVEKVTEDFEITDVVDGCPIQIVNPQNDYLFVSHIDRIRVPFVKPMLVKSGIVPYIQGQLDNSICVAMLKVLSASYNYNIMFTREEECCYAQHYVVKAINELEIKYGKKFAVIDCDIDVFYKDDSWINSISLRSRDNVSLFTEDIVSRFRGLATSVGVNYSAKTDWLIGTVGWVRAKDPSIEGLYLGLPILNYHSEREIVALDTLYSYMRVLEALGMLNDIKIGDYQDDDISYDSEN